MRERRRIRRPRKGNRISMAGMTGTLPRVNEDDGSCEILNVAVVMATIKLRRERCKGCGLCIAACPKGILRLGTRINRSGYPYVEVKDMDACTGCALCAEMCPDVAILVYK